MLNQRTLECTVTEPKIETDDIMIILFQCIDKIREEEEHDVEANERTA